jgi:hypothetical protein
VKLKALEDGLALFGNEFSKNDIAGGAHAASLEEFQPPSQPGAARMSLSTSDGAMDVTGRSVAMEKPPE